MQRHYSMKKTPVTLLAAAIGLGLQWMAFSAMAQDQAGTAADGANGQDLDEIKVVGFKASLIKALDDKQRAAEPKP